MTLDAISYNLAKKAYGLAAKSIQTAKVTFNLSQVNIPNETSHTLARFTNPAGKEIKVWKMQVGDNKGNYVSDLQLRIKDRTNNIMLHKTDSNVVEEGNPLGRGGEGCDIDIYIWNMSGAAHITVAFAVISIEEV